MGDYLLDFRKPARSRARAQDFLLFYPDMEVDSVCTDQFDLTLTRIGPADLWAPYASPDGTIVALAGRVALDPAEWQNACSLPGEGGLACKAIYNRFSTAGVEDL